MTASSLFRTLLLGLAACSSSSSNISPTGVPDDASRANAVPDGVGSSGCNWENPAVMAKYNPTKGCFDDPAPVPGICNGTSSEGAGFGGLACAFAADGTVYAETVCENCGLSGAGFQYSQFVFNGDMPDTPAGEKASAAQIAQCTSFNCVPLCSTGQPYGVAPFGGTVPMNCVDAGDAPDSSNTDAGHDAAR